MARRVKKYSAIHHHLLLLFILFSTIQYKTFYCDAAAAAAAASLSTKLPLLSELPQQQQQQQLSKSEILKELNETTNTSNRTTTTTTPSNIQSISTTTTTTTTTTAPSPTSTTASNTKDNTKYIVSLAYLSGLSDILSHRKYHCYTSMMTGNVIHFISSLMEHNTKQGMKLGKIIGCYILGVAYFHVKLNNCHQQTRKQQPGGGSNISGVAKTVLILFLLSETIHSFSSFSILQPLLSSLRAPLLSLAHGIINAASTECITSNTITFALTGHVTKIGTFFADYTSHVLNNSRKKKRRYKVKQTTKTSVRVLSFFILGLCSGLLGYVILDNFTLDVNNNKASSSSSSSSLEIYGIMVLQKIQNIPPFTIIGCLYALVLHFGMNDYNTQQQLLQQQQKQQQQERVVIKNDLSSSSSSSSTSKPKKKRRKRSPTPSSSEDTLMDGWTNLPKGPRPFRG